MDRFHRCLRRIYASNGQTSQLIKESIGDLLESGILQGQQCCNNCFRNTKFRHGCRSTGTDREKSSWGSSLFGRKQGERKEGIKGRERERKKQHRETERKRDSKNWLSANKLLVSAIVWQPCSWPPHSDLLIKFHSSLFSGWTCKLWCVKECDSLAGLAGELDERSGCQELEKGHENRIP